MAYIEKTAFERRVTNHEFDAIANITGIFRNGDSAAEDCSAGFLCVRDAVTDNEGYTDVGPTDATVTLKNTNTWYMKAAGASDIAQKGIYACNPYGVNMVTDPVTGAAYKMGSGTLGVRQYKGIADTYTQISFNNVNVYRFGEGNVNGTVGSNTIFTIAAGLLVPASAAPTANGAPYFELVGSGTFTQGAYNGFGYYDLRACMTVAAVTNS